MESSRAADSTSSTASATTSRRTRPRQGSFRRRKREGRCFNRGGASAAKSSASSEDSSSEDSSAYSSLERKTSLFSRYIDSGSSPLLDSSVMILDASANGDSSTSAATTPATIASADAHAATRLSRSTGRPTFKLVGFSNDSPAKRVLLESCSSVRRTARAMALSSAKKTWLPSRVRSSLAIFAGGVTSRRGTAPSAGVRLVRAKHAFEIARAVSSGGGCNSSSCTYARHAAGAPADAGSTCDNSGGTDRVGSTPSCCAVASERG